MTFDINLLRGILTAILLFAFIGLWIWAWSKKREPAFNEAAGLPFADEPISRHSGVHQSPSSIQPKTGEHSA